MIILSGLITHKPPPPNRIGKCDGEMEAHLSEAAVMLAFAMFLVEDFGCECVEIHPDGQHGKRFDIAGWLGDNGFVRQAAIGSTTYGGEYLRGDGAKIVVDPRSGLGDVVTRRDENLVVAECKGGIVNTNHPGQKSRLYSGLCEIIGLLMAKEAAEEEYAVVPSTPVTRRLAQRMHRRCQAAGITICLVETDGTVLVQSGS